MNAELTVRANGGRATTASKLIMAIAQAAKQSIIEQQNESRHTELKRLRVTVTKRWRQGENPNHMIPCVQVVAEAHLLERDGTTLDL